MFIITLSMPYLLDNVVSDIKLVKNLIIARSVYPSVYISVRVYMYELDCMSYSIIIQNNNMINTLLITRDLLRHTISFCPTDTSVLTHARLTLLQVLRKVHFI